MTEPHQQQKNCVVETSNDQKSSSLCSKKNDHSRSTSSLRERLRGASHPRGSSSSSNTAAAGPAGPAGIGSNSTTRRETDPALELILAITGSLSLGLIILMVNIFIYRLF